MAVFLTREQVRRVDAVAIHELGIPGVVLMENAGRNAADRIAEVVRRTAAERVVIFCGTGNNGGDGFVIARHLRNRGLNVLVFLAGDPDRLTPDAGVHYRILRAMGIAVHPAGRTGTTGGIRGRDVVVDALLGTGFEGDVREPLASLIEGINGASKAAVVAVDVPSGLDCDTGRPCNATIRADLTVTFVAGKVGFATETARAYTGEVVVADIGAPSELVDRVVGD